MTTTVDFDALQAAQGVKVTLMENEQAGPLVTGTDYADFSDFASVELRVDARLLNGNRGTPALTVTVQHSDDGDSWSTAHTFTFGVGGDGVQTASVSSPKAHFRATAVASLSEWLVRFVTAAPGFLDPPSGDSSGGSQPGIRRVDVPLAFDTTNILTGILGFTLAENEFVLSHALIVIEPFDGTSPTLHIAGDLGDLPGSTAQNTVQNADASAASQIGTSNLYDGGGTLNDGNGPYALGGSAPCYVYLDDSSGGDPESTQGDVTWVFLIASEA